MAWRKESLHPYGNYPPKEYMGKLTHLKKVAKNPTDSSAPHRDPNQVKKFINYFFFL